MELRLTVQGIDPETIARALAAARKVLDDEQMDAETAANGYFALEGWDDAGFPDDGDFALTAEDSRAADVWLKAEEAAVRVCYPDWPEGPEPDCSLELDLPEREKPDWLKPDPIATAMFYGER